MIKTKAKAYIESRKKQERWVKHFMKGMERWLNHVWRVIGGQDKLGNIIKNIKWMLEGCKKTHDISWIWNALAISKQEMQGEKLLETKFDILRWIRNFMLILNSLVPNLKWILTKSKSTSSSFANFKCTKRI